MLPQEKQVVLLVDDTASTLKLLTNTLMGEYRVLVATNGFEALEIAFRRRPDLILLDIMLPDVDGYEVCQRLKAEPLTQEIPVVFITSMNQEVDEARGLKVGAIDYITKPFSPAIVQARVRNHMELKRYRDLLEKLSTTDGLTGIPNRRQFDQFLEREWRRAYRNQFNLSLIMMDIDFFKHYNDLYGHVAGDDCLRQVAQALNRTICRPADLVARYGGEEFVCVLPETDLPGAIWMAKQMQENVLALKIPHQSSHVADYVSLSLGAAGMIPEAGQSAISLIEQADIKLYEAKHNGRNLVRS
jgi:diguanylate cyclase (GGDEF)-like protein